MTHEPKTPGEAIRAALAADSRSLGWLAKGLIVSRMTAWRLAHDQQRVNAKIAVRLSATFDGRTAKEWLDLQNAADLEGTKQEAGA